MGKLPVFFPPAEEGSAKIAYGSYVGTGESGVNSPNVLEFPFDVKLVIVGEFYWFAAVQGMERAQVPDANSEVHLSWPDSKTLRWYAYDQASQCNIKDKTCHWVAFG